MSNRILIEVDDSDILSRLSAAAAATADLTPLMSEIEGIMVDATERAFMQQRDPTTGVPWAALSETTKSRRRDPAGPILQDSSSLVQSVTGRHDATSAEVGVAEKYGITHQLGAKRGQYGSTSRGSAIPWGDIPARPFLGLGEDDKNEIMDAANRYISSSF